MLIELPSQPGLWLLTVGRPLLATLVPEHIRPLVPQGHRAGRAGPMQQLSTGRLPFSRGGGYRELPSRPLEASGAGETTHGREVDSRDNLTQNS